MLRIACYGLVDQEGSSAVGANFILLEELIKRGFKVDFYGRKDYVYPYQLCKYKNFKLIEVKQSILGRCSNFVTGTNNLLLVRRAEMLLLRQKILANHEENKYDFLICLGLRSGIKLKNIPTISWLQGIPHMQWNMIQKLKKEIVSYDGYLLFLKLKAFYKLRIRLADFELKNSDLLICSSQWTKKQLIINGINTDVIKVLPLPVNNNLFKPSTDLNKNKQASKKVFLWLGRSEPRKRLDLLLKAYSLVLQERQDVHLKVIGGFSYAKGYKKLIDSFHFPEYLEYKSSVDKYQVPTLMSQCDFLIQPSEGEDFGSSVAEALYCGLPVIVGPTNGTKDYISSSSFVFEEYEPESLKKTMLEAINSLERNQEKLALDAIQTAQANFDLKKIVDRLEDIFKEVLETDFSLKSSFSQKDTQTILKN
jgi:glycosyltransferase involved in cell wall biosynthesis